VDDGMDEKSGILSPHDSELADPDPVNHAFTLAHGTKM
jgi:hypothetical protein